MPIAIKLQVSVGVQKGIEIRIDRRVTASRSPSSGGISPVEACSRGSEVGTRLKSAMANGPRRFSPVHAGDIGTEPLVLRFTL